jgi:hypothetical protein
VVEIKITGVHLAGGTRLEHISELRWFWEEGPEIGVCTKQQLVDWLKASLHKATCRHDYHIAEVFVVDDHDPPYVKTRADDTKEDNLLHQPQDWPFDGEYRLPSGRASTWLGERKKVD